MGVSAVNLETFRTGVVYKTGIVALSISGFEAPLILAWKKCNRSGMKTFTRGGLVSAKGYHRKP